MSPRMRFLLETAAEWLMDGRDPLDGAFLSEHDVTLDEAYSLAERMSLAISLFLLMGDT